MKITRILKTKFSKMFPLFLINPCPSYPTHKIHFLKFGFSFWSFSVSFCKHFSFHERAFAITDLISNKRQRNNCFIKFSTFGFAKFYCCRSQLTWSDRAETAALINEKRASKHKLGARGILATFCNLWFLCNFSLLFLRNSAVLFKLFFKITSANSWFLLPDNLLVYQKRQKWINLLASSKTLKSSAEFRARVFCIPTQAHCLSNSESDGK